jgi:hypothetical protein
MTFLTRNRREAAIGAALCRTHPDTDSGTYGPRVRSGRPKVPGSILAALVVVLTAACGDPASGEQLATGATDASMPGYATQVNALCKELIDEVLPITQDKPNPTPEEFLGFATQIDPLLAQFDAKLDAIEVAQEDSSAAQAFDAYRSSVDEGDGELRQVALTGDRAAFEVARRDFLDELSSSREMVELHAEGIVCPAR